MTRSLILLLIGLSFYSTSTALSCAGDKRTLTERLFQGNPGVIFTCKILSIEERDKPTGIYSDSSGSPYIVATTEIVRLYFGKIDTNIISIKSASSLKVDKIFLVYTDWNNGSLSFGGVCDRWSKEVTTDSMVTNELILLDQFSSIINNQKSGLFEFKDHKNQTLAKGQFKEGKPVKTWLHYYNNGTLKSKFNLSDDITSHFSKNGNLSYTIKRLNNESFTEVFSTDTAGKLMYSTYEIKNDTGNITTSTEYYDNGKVKNIISRLNINSAHQKYSKGKIGEFKEYFENGVLNVQGYYKDDRRIGLWKWYYSDGKFNAQFDYQDGANPQ